MKKMLIGSIVLVGLLFALPMFGQVSVDAPEMPERVDVTFQYENPSANDVFLIGGFNGWTEEDEEFRMTENEDGLWEYTMNVRSNQTLIYKFFVDGEYITDPNAPATQDDGFGGLNGRVNVAGLLGGTADDGEGLIFGMYTRIWSDTTWLTKDVLDGTEDGMDLDEVALSAKSYWKLQGEVFPGVSTFIEIQAFDNTTQLWKSNTDGDDTPFVTAADGGQSLGDFLFNPFTNLHGGNVSMLGHFKADLETPWLDVRTGYHWAKGAEHDFIYTTKDEMDANDGYVELVPKIDLGDVASLSAVVAPNKVKGTHGVYSWAQVEVADFTIDLAVNSLSGDEDGRLYYYLDDAKYMAALGVGGDIMEGLSFKTQGLMNFGAPYDEVADTISAAVQVNYEMADLFGIDLDYRFGGDDSETLFGDDGDLKKGLHFVSPYFWVQPIDMLRFMLDTEFEYVIDSESLNAFPLTPEIQVDVNEDIRVNLTSTFTLDVDNDDDDAEVFDFNEVSARVRMNNLVDILGTTYLSLGYLMGDDVDFISLLAETSIDKFTVYAGGIARLAHDEWEDKDTVSAYGATVGTRFDIESETFLEPTFFADFSYNFNPYDDGETEKGFEFENYRPDDLSAGAGSSKLSLGLLWDF